MKNVAYGSKNRWRRALKFFFILHSAFMISLCRAEDYGDISVNPTAIYTGNTFHGYAETRVILENHSLGKTHTVTLISPNRSWDNGNSISRLSRTVTLAPSTREIVSLLQPPLPLGGEGMRVQLDGRDQENLLNAPNARNHCNYSYSGSGFQPTLLVSRNLDFDAVNTMMQGNGKGVTSSRGTTSAASEATGAPDAYRSGRKNLSAAWAPSYGAGTGANWLEVDYAPAKKSTGLTIHSVQAPLSSGSITVTGISGTNLLTQPMTMGKRVSDHGHGWNIEFTFPETVEAVKTVRIDFGSTPPPAIAIDGVALAGSTGSQWAAAARASSENTFAPPPVYSPGTTPADSIECLRAEAPATGWSENWLGYTPFDALILNATDLGAMPPAVFNAISDYLFAGGNVILMGQAELPSAWHSLRKVTSSTGGNYQIGLGKCFVFPVANITDLDAASVQTLRETVRDASRYWQSLPNDGATANATFPVVDNLKIPTRGLVIIMLAFVIIIGPVNIILLNRRKRRTWMLWTIPAISVATTLLVFVYSLLREGITPDTRIAGLTVLDQVNHRAATVGVTAFYCPLTPSGGLRFNFETEATPLVRVGYGSGNSREVDWTQTQAFQRGWVSARVPAHFHLRKSETRRERVQIVNENGKIQIINSLGAPIKSIWVADMDMNIYEAHDVAAGQKHELSRSTQPYVSGNGGASALLHDLSFVASPDSLGGTAKYLSSNSYIAVLDSNPFIENALSSASAKHTKSSAVIFGILDSSDAP